MAKGKLDIEYGSKVTPNDLNAPNLTTVTE
jgi:hypothetical protein